jgi:23S rRNA (cytosine1962-C5)-methyltransferase
MKTITIKKTKRLTAGHLWVFSNEIAHKLTDYAPGELVEMVDAKGEYLATGYVNPHTLIAARVLSRKRTSIDEAFITARLEDAIDYRRRLYPNLNACRLVFGEADLLPGLIMDKYADTIVIQTLTAGMDGLQDMIVAVIDRLLAPSCIVLRNDSSFRELEGLDRDKTIAKGGISELPVIEENGVHFEVDVIDGQKTGFFLDQRENRAAFARLIDGGEGLDLFAYAGAWAMHLARQGANVTCVDTSAGALDRVTRNAELNDTGNNVTTVRSDVFEFLRTQQKAGRTYDFVVLDPPAFAKTKANLPNAVRAYRQINTAAMSVIKRGGFLATSSCSYHISADVFLDAVHNAARANSRYARLVEYRSQAKDHPSLLGMPETRYLKCAILQVM